MAATKKLKQSELMMQAGATGESAVQRSQESRTRNRQQTLSRKESARQFNKSIEQQELDRWQRQWEVQRQDRAQRDAVRAENQAGKKDMTIFGQQGRAQRDAEAAYKRESVSDREKFDETKRQFDESQGLDAAKHGLRAKPEGGQASPSFADRHAGAATQAGNKVVQVPTSGSGESNEYITQGSDIDRTGAQASLDPRMQQLQQEMDQRGQEQMGQPLELGTQGSQWIADPSTPAAQTARAKAQSAQLTAIKQRQALGFKMQEAQAKLDAANTKENKAFLKEAEIKAQAQIANFSDRFTKFDNAQTVGSDKPTKSDWASLRKLVEESNLPAAGGAESVHFAVGEEKVNSRLVEWMGERRAKMAIQYVANGTGELPDREYVDFLTEGMKQFMDKVQVMRLKTKMDFGGPVGLMSATTRARQRRVVQKMAAKAILGGNTMALGPEGTQGNTEATMAGQPTEASAQPGAGAPAAGAQPGAAPMAQTMGATGGQTHAAAPGASQMAGGPRNRAKAGTFPPGMSPFERMKGKQKDWSEVK